LKPALLRCSTCAIRKVLAHTGPAASCQDGRGSCLKTRCTTLVPMPSFRPILRMPSPLAFSSSIGPPPLPRPSRPSFVPFALARARPALTRSRISSLGSDSYPLEQKVPAGFGRRLDSRSHDHGSILHELLSKSSVTGNREDLMDRITRCPKCGKSMVPVVTISGRTELQCISCDDPAVKWAQSPLTAPDKPIAAERV
jgi:hypothetical protein